MKISVVIATYNRLALLRELLDGLSRQTFRDFEVVVVDDGSREPAKPVLDALKPPFPLRVFAQANAGAAAARHRGVCEARGEVIVIVDDDMQVPPDFLESHARAHDAGATLVLGHIVEDGENRERKPLFERMHTRLLNRMWEDLRARRMEPRGVHVCTGNVSFRRAEYMDVGGFDRALDRSEDKELGVRLEKHGAKVGFAYDARTFNRSDHTDLDVWMRRNFLYGIYDLRIAKKHPDVEVADPWRVLFEGNKLSRPFLALSVAAPGVGKILARAAMRTAMALDEVGAERVALAGATLVFGLEYFRGMREEAGSLGGAVRELRAYMRKRRAQPVSPGRS